MFNRNANKGIDSILGVQTQIKGEIKSKGAIRIEGTFEGNLEADLIFMGESGYVVGVISARKVLVGGKIEGNITARESVEIKPKGKVVGDIITERLIILEGGILEGHSTMRRENNSSVIEFPQKI
jgi:cytoskeletal protein CcmA (bactofilin family)